MAKKYLDYDKEAIKLIEDEKRAWENGTVWVSSGAYFTMAGEIDSARKNYYGQFEEPTDSRTGLEKMWVPLTEWTVERNVANTDLDTKDIHLRHPQGKDLRAPVTMKLILLNFLKKIYFGETLNDVLRRLNIDGTSIVKCFKQYSEEYKRNLPVIKIVDPLNFIIDPAAYSIQEVPVIEKSIMNRPEIERYRGKWKDLNKIAYTGTVPNCVIYERWGKIPLSFITHKDQDDDTWVEGTIIASAAEHEVRTIHSIQRNTDGVKPYEECWLKRVPGRWHGRGIPEMITGLQTWLNTVVNIRRDEMLNKLGGKYKIRKGAGITRQMLESIRAGGALMVDDMNDIMELRESDVKPSAYREPIDIVQMAEKVSGAKEVPTSPTMQPTTAVLQERGVKGISNLIQENVGLFLERLFKRHYIPQTISCLKENEILRITGDPEDLAIIDEAYERYVLQQAKSPSLAGKRRLRERVRNQIKRWGNDRPMKVLKRVFDTDYDLEVYITAERIDPAIIMRNLNDFLLSYGRLPQADINIINDVVKEQLSHLEIPISRKIKPMPKVGAPGLPGATPQPRKETPTSQTEFQRANIEGTLSPAER